MCPIQRYLLIPKCYSSMENVINGARMMTKFRSKLFLGYRSLYSHSWANDHGG